MNEDTGNTVGSGNTDLTPTKKKDIKTIRRENTVVEDYAEFKVPPSTFAKFNAGRNKFERWSKFLDLSDDEQMKLYNYATQNPKNTIVLRCSETGALRGIRRRSACGV